MTKYVEPSGSWPKSLMSMMCGFPMALAARASWRKRSVISVSLRHLAAQDLDGDLLVDDLVAPGVDDAHPAFAEHALDQVAAIDGLADVRVDLRRGRRPGHDGVQCVHPLGDRRSHRDGRCRRRRRMVARGSTLLGFAGAHAHSYSAGLDPRRGTGGGGRRFGRVGHELLAKGYGKAAEGCNWMVQQEARPRARAGLSAISGGPDFPPPRPVRLAANPCYSAGRSPCPSPRAPSHPAHPALPALPAAPNPTWATRSPSRSATSRRRSATWSPSARRSPSAASCSASPRSPS